MGASTSKDKTRSRHGRCTPCKTTYHWTGLPDLRNALCPKCKAQLTFGSLHGKGAHKLQPPLTAPSAQEKAP